MPRFHGVGRCVRKGGTTSSLGLGRRMPGTRSTKRMGNKNTTAKLKVFSYENHFVNVLGSVAGKKNTIVKIWKNC